MEIIISAAFGVWIAVTAFVYRSLTGNGKGGQNK